MDIYDNVELGRYEAVIKKLADALQAYMDDDRLDEELPYSVCKKTQDRHKAAREALDSIPKRATLEELLQKELDVWRKKQGR